jgi:hypothetical protein
MLDASVIGSPRHSRRKCAQIEDTFDGSQDWVIAHEAPGRGVDPNDRGMLDVAGFDTTVPAVIADFVRE